MGEKILIAGGTGLIGSFLANLAANQGYRVHILSRRKHKDNGNIRYFKWDPNLKTIETGALDVDHVINLCGAGIADERWTKKRKMIITESRTKPARFLFKKLKNVDKKLKSYIGASAIGIYGDRRDEKLIEKDISSENNFLVNTCKLWENEHMNFKNLADRVIIFRISVVLSINGGALQKILLPMNMGINGYFGSGRQYYSWIHIEDMANMILYGLANNSMNGIYNASSPMTFRNKEFQSIVAKAFEKRALLIPAPVFILRPILGEMLNILLMSTNVSSEKIVKHGFTFKFPNLEEALKNLNKEKI